MQPQFDVLCSAVTMASQADLTVNETPGLVAPSTVQEIPVAVASCGNDNFQSCACISSVQFR